jgi:ankyrin repeat protein
MKKRLFVVTLVGVFLVNSIFAAADWRIQKELYDAIKADNTKKIESLLAKYPKLINKKIEYHGYPVLDAARTGRLKALKLLVEKGADIKKKAPKSGNSIIHLVAENFRMKKETREAFFEYIIKEKKLKLGIKNKAGQTPFNYAFTSNPRTPAVKGGIEVIDVFEKYGADLNSQDASGITVLNYLVQSCRLDRDDPDKTNLKVLDIAKALIEKKGVNINLPDNIKRTPLVTFLVHTKKMSDDKKIDFVTFLMENGALTKQKSKKGEKALKLVEKKGDLYKVMKKKYKKKKKK